MKKVCIALFILLIAPFSAVHAQEATTTPDISTSTPEEIVPDPVDIHLQVEGPESTIFDDDVSVAACTTPNNASSTVNGFCAFESAGLPVNATWFSFGALIDAIGGIAGDAENFWLWFLNGDVASVGIDSYLLEPDDYVLWALGRQPTKISASTLTPEVGGTTTITVLGFDPFGFAFVPLADAFLEGIGATTTDAGTFELVATSTDPLRIRATAEGYLPSPFLTLSAAAQETPPPPPPAPSPPPPSGGGNSSNDDQEFDVPAALSYLASAHEPDTSFITDWVAIAYGASNGGSAEVALRTFLSSAQPLLSSVTDYERHAMALMALGINPYSDTGTDYIAPIVEAFDGTQIGSGNEVNDDIFALFPLLKAGYGKSDEIVQKTTAFIVAEQETGGSWKSSVDMTAAGIQALAEVQDLPGVGDALASARGYLEAHQENGGGFGDPFATSWTMQAIAALGEDPSDWAVNSDDPAEYLAKQQSSDGGMLDPSQSSENRVWATAYAIPASLGKPWPELLSSFSKPSEQSVNEGSGDGSGSNDSSTSSEQATSTASTATSTGLVLGEATSTGSIYTPHASSQQAIMTANPAPIVPNVLARSQTPFPAPAPATETEIATTSTDTNAQFAAATESTDEMNGNWLWLAGLLLVLGVGFYFLRSAK